MSPHLRYPIIPKKDYNMWRVILNDSKLLKNPRYISESFNVAIEKVNAVIQEHRKSECVIIQSKINNYES